MLQRWANKKEDGGYRSMRDVNQRVYEQFFAHQNKYGRVNEFMFQKWILQARHQSQFAL